MKQLNASACSPKTTGFLLTQKNAPPKRCGRWKENGPTTTTIL